VWSGDFVGEIAIWFGFELIHDDAQNASAAFVRAPACGFHHTQIASGANCETGISQEFTDALRVGVFGIGLVAFGAAKDSYDPLLCFTRHRDVQVCDVTKKAIHEKTRTLTKRLSVVSCDFVDGSFIH
jgi:hypothetical protein